MATLATRTPRGSPPNVPVPPGPRPTARPKPSSTSCYVSWPTLGPIATTLSASSSFPGSFTATVVPDPISASEVEPPSSDCVNNIDGKYS